MASTDHRRQPKVLGEHDVRHQNLFRHVCIAGVSDAAWGELDEERRDLVRMYGVRGTVLYPTAPTYHAYVLVRRIYGYSTSVRGYTTALGM